MSNVKKRENNPDAEMITIEGLGTFSCITGVSDELEKDWQKYPEFRDDVADFFERFCRCDWGDVSPAEAEENRKTVKDKRGRLTGNYLSLFGEIYFDMYYDPRDDNMILSVNEYDRHMKVRALNKLRRMSEEPC